MVVSYDRLDIAVSLINRRAYCGVQAKVVCVSCWGLLRETDLPVSCRGAISSVLSNNSLLEWLSASSSFLVFRSRNQPSSQDW